MSSMVEAVHKAKLGLPCTELLKTMIENDKIMYLTVLRYYTYWQTYSISINLCLCCLELYFCIKPEIGISSFSSCLGVTTKDKVTLPRYWIAV